MNDKIESILYLLCYTRYDECKFRNLMEYLIINLDECYEKKLVQELYQHYILDRYPNPMKVVLEDVLMALYINKKFDML